MTKTTKIFITAIKIFLIALIIFIAGALITYFPLQKYLAKKSVDEYMKKQHITAAEIESKEMFHDFKFGGYRTHVKVKGDKKYTYVYHYVIFKRQADSNLRWEAFDDTFGYGEDDPPKDIKYPPLKQNN